MALLVALQLFVRRREPGKAESACLDRRAIVDSQRPLRIRLQAIGHKGAIRLRNDHPQAGVDRDEGP